ncbi:uncharacterized protein V6R79_021073 [Siganus canaliculatus]
MSQRDLKEAFVSNLNGTTPQEIMMGSLLAPLCLICRGLILMYFCHVKGTLPLSLPLISHLLLDYSLLVVPLTLVCTVLNNHLSHLILSLAVVSACGVCCMYYISRRSSAQQSANTVSTFLQNHIQFNQVPFVTFYRVLVNVKTAICILAVDFHIFPRRYAKTETYGTGLMDIGVGAFVFANALVSPEARRKSISGSKMNHMKKQLLSVWPLVFLGMGRLVSVKMTGYQEHVTEYGVHWNFFFTLALVKVLTSVFFTVLPASHSWLYALLMSGFYQFTLEMSGLKTFILHNTDRDRDFLHANKEGIFSVLSFVAIYMAGVQVGLYVTQPRSQVRQWMKVIFNLSLASAILYAALYACETLVEPVSRRLTNLPYCIWNVAEGLFYLSCCSAADMVLLFLKKSSGCHLVPSSWNLFKKESNSVSEKQSSEVQRHCLVQAISRNQLLFFLLANVLTGITNFTVDTLSCSSLFSTSCTITRLEETMARLVAVCREGEEDYPFLARQIPLYIDDTLTMVMEFSDTVVDVESHERNTCRWKQFCEYYSKLKQQDLNIALMVTSREVYSALSQLVPCVGCRRSVERLFSHMVESGNPALEPLTVKPTGMLSVSKACLADVKKLYTLFYVHGSKLNDMIDAIPKSKKNKRCQLHSLDTHKPKPLGGSWMDVWELMSQECRDEVVVIDSTCLLETLKTYLRKHRFCTDCKSKVLRAYNILVGELDCTKEKGYCAALYEGLCCCPHERHIHVCCETDFIAHLLGRAEPEFSGGYERRERHAKTIDIAQEEVLTCVGIHLYERLHRIWQKLRAEEQTWQILFHLGIDALRKSFEMAVEKMQGISRLEQFVEELSEEERAKELKQEKKRQKRKNRRKNKCGFGLSEQEAEDNAKNLEDSSLESVEVSCKVCCSHDEEEEAGCDETISANEGSSCSCPENTKQDLSPLSNSSDCGYSSMEGSEMGSREGSEVACSEGLCNHDETGDESNAPHCAEDKEDDGIDACVDSWPHTVEHTQCKSKKKKRKNKGLCSNQGRNGEGRLPQGNTADHSTTPTPLLHCCRSPSFCGDAFASVALRLPWTVHEKNLNLHAGPPDANMSLVGLLDDSEVTSDEENCLTQDEIQAFLKRNQSFYNNRHQYRLLLKEKFTNYCRACEQGKPGCGKWFAHSSVG